ncbi:hypothetical protein DCI52_23355 [Salmonella enterica subsp. enterica serovar Typhimurium]|nr:hypothetical protein [Salmonella enterica subsp. enterica serovar Typhimurium]
MRLPVKIRRDWHYYAFSIGLIFILNGVVGLLGFEAKGWQTYGVGLVTWIISFWQRIDLVNHDLIVCR